MSAKSTKFRVTPPVTADKTPYWLQPKSLGFVLVLVTLIAYLPALKAGFVWDDDWYVTQNPHLQDLAGLARLWVPGSRPQYYPAVFTTFWGEYQLWGLDPFGYHLVNVVLHALNALLAWRLSSALKIPGAWWVGAVFALHPVHVESVAWVTERKNVLSGLFYFLSALAYLRFDPMNDGDNHAVDATASAHVRTRWRWYAVALVCFVLALLSKTVTCSLPAALILAMLWRRVPLTWGRLAPLVPMFAIGMTLALHTAHLERTNVGADGVDFAFGAADRLWIASNALGFYPLKLLWPWPLIFIYPRWQLPGDDLFAYWPVAALLVVVVAALIAFKRGWRGPPIALAFFAGTLFPALGFFNVYPMRYSFVADHFQYLASLGIIALIVSGLSLLAQRTFVIGIGVVALVSLGALTSRRCEQYADAETLWRVTARDNPQAWMALSNLAKVQSEKGDNDAALVSLDRALATDLSDRAANQVRLNRAMTLGKLRRLPEALDQYLQLQESNGGMEIRVAQTLERLGRRAEADSYYEQALKGRAADSARVPYAVHMMERGRADVAIEVLELFVVSNETDVDALMFLADAYARTSRVEAARTTARRALALARAKRDFQTAEIIEKRLAQLGSGD